MATCTVNPGFPATETSYHTIHAATGAAADVNSVTPSVQETVREIAFIDPNISDLNSFRQGVRPEIEAHLLTADEPAPLQMARVLAGRRGLEAIHVVAHGRPGEVSFAAGVLSVDTIENEPVCLPDLRPALAADGALHIWACQTGAGERGTAFVDLLAERTGARVAAASGLVGAEARGGTWALDKGVSSHRPPLTVECMATYAGVMTTFNGTTGADVADASTGTITGFSGGNAANLTDTTGDTFNGGTGADTIIAGSGNDTINIANGQFVAGEVIQGGANTSTGIRDQIVLTSATTVDFSAGTVSGIETLTGNNGGDTVTMTAVQWAGFSTIDLNGGTDVLNVLASGDISALATPTLSSVETGNLTGTSGTDTVTLTGAQLDAIIIGAGTIDLGAGAGDTINLTSTSANLNTLGATNGSIQGVEAISASGAAAGVSINLSGQTEAFTITGSAQADTITGGSAADTISAGGGNDTVNIGTNTFTAGDSIDGGTGIDTILLAPTGDGISADFTAGTITNVENLTSIDQGFGNGYNQTLSVTASQWAGLTSINMNDGTDVLNVLASGDISAFATPTLNSVDVGNLTGTSGADTVTLTGAQLDAIIIGAGTIDLGAGAGDTINLTSTSADLNTLGATNGSIQGVEAISVSGAAAGVSINLSGQTEAFTITGSAHADTITGGAGNDTIDGGTGAGDTVILGGARADYTISLSGSTYTVVDNRGGSPGGTDTLTEVENFQFSDGMLTAGQLDVTAPNISAVAFGAHDGTLKAGEGVDIVVTFSEAVMVTGTPTLTLSNGAIATLVGGSGTDTLTFHYAAASGEDASDITIASYNLAATGTTIGDAQGNLVTTAGAPTDPGGAGDIEAVDTTAPTASITLDPITTDGIISIAEAGGTVTVTGTVGGEVRDGDIVTLTINGTLYSGAVSGGTFGIDVLGSNLAADADSIVEASVTATDAAGNSTTVSDTQSYTGPNDAPVVNANDGSLAYTENQTAAAIDTALTLSDADNATLTGATVSITGNFASGEDVLGFTDQNGIAGSYDASTGVLTLSGTATVAHYEAALRSVSYFNASEAPSGAARTISFQVDDGQTENHSSNVATAIISVTPVDDAALIDGVTTGSVTENAATTVSGTLTADDIDNPNNAFQANSGNAAYGSWSIDAAGSWSYILDNGNPAVDALNDGDTLSDSFTILSVDGTTQQVTVTIAGANDAAVLSSAAVNLSETDTALSTGGTLTSVDVDGPSTFIAQVDTAGTYGTFSIDANGAWAYTANSAFDGLGTGETLIDTYAVSSADGTTTSVTVTIAGTNDAAIIDGVTTGSVTENAATTVSGTLTADDIDNPDNAFQANFGNAAYGSWSIDAAGSWSYILDNGNPAVDALNAGDTLSDSFTILSVDGTTQQVTVTIAGANDAAINHAPTGIGLSGASVTELAARDTLVADLTANDADAGESFRFDLLNPDGRFKIVGDKLLVDNGLHLDFEQARSHDVTVKVTDKGGASFIKTFTINVGDVAHEIAKGSAISDKIVGGSSYDKLWGGLGNDFLTGGRGKDTFVFDTKLDKKKNVDTITDFSSKDDSIYLDNAIFKNLGKKGSPTKPIKMDSKMFWTGTKAHDKDDHIIYNKKTGALYYDADGNGGAAQIKFGQIKKGTTLTDKDFFVI